ncbi:MAG: YutD family protein [Bacilli bacterium]|nr:YutD family protein [Bacilli bacterium]
MKIGNNEYEIIENYKEGFELDKVKELYTDYFDDYDYILGDWSYGKLRLKGFCDKRNIKCNRINDIKYKDKYIKELCSYDCRYFIIKKLVK